MPRRGRAGNRTAGSWPRGAAALLPAGVVGLLLVAGAAPAIAQQGGPGRWSAGGGVALTVPTGEFAEFVDEGLGLGGDVTYFLDPAGVLGLRLDLAAVTYGSERNRVPLSRTVGRVRVDVTTRNNILLLGVGPRLGVPVGPVRPWVGASVGLGYFYTQSSVRGSRDPRFREFATTTNYDDLSLSYGLGGGVSVPISRGPRSLALGLDVQLRRHGSTRYLREGGIREDGTGNVFLEPLESEADVVVVRLGVSGRF